MMGGGRYGWSWRAVAVVVVVVGALAGCGSTVEVPKAEAMKNLMDAYPNASAATQACFASVLARFSDADISAIVHNKPNSRGNETAVGYEACLAAPGATVPSTNAPTGDPLLDELLADPVGWMQARWDTIDQALCGGQPALLDSVYASASTDLPTLKGQAGSACPTVTVLSVTGSDNNPLTGSNIRQLSPDEIQFYTADSGWIGDNHAWSVHLVHEDGVLKILSSS